MFHSMSRLALAGFVLVAAPCVAAPCVAAPCVAATCAAAQHVHKVGPTAAFTQIQPAIDAAADGDVVLVAPGIYDPFVVDGRALTIQGEPGVRVNRFVLPPILGTPGRALEVRNVAASQHLVVREIDFDLHYAEPYACALLSSCDGSVVFEDCSFAASHGNGVSAGNCAALTFTRCVLRSDGPFQPASSNIWQTNAGLRVNGGDVFLFDSLLVGSGGKDSLGFIDIETSDGGTGLLVGGGAVYASGCTISGGEGGSYAEHWMAGCVPLGDGGPGLVTEELFGPIDVYLFDTDVVGGPGAQPDPTCTETPGVDGPDQVIVSGDVHLLSGERRTFGFAGRVREGEQLAVGYVGEPGDAVLLLVSPGAGSGSYDPFLELAPHVDPSALVLFVRGVVPPSGVLLDTLTVPDVAPTLGAATFVGQALFVDGTGALRLSAPSQTVVLDAAL